MDMHSNDDRMKQEEAWDTKVTRNPFNRGVADETGMPNVKNNPDDVGGTTGTDSSGDLGNVMGAAGTDRQGNMPPASGGG